MVSYIGKMLLGDWNLRLSCWMVFVLKVGLLC